MLVEWSDFYYSSEGEDIMAHGLRTPEKQYVKIEVRNPRTHISREKALYTDYEILVETNNIAFASSDSCVRRRYSDFQWLRNRLLSQYGLEKNLPELPAKRLFGRFKRQFLKHRQKGLQRFLEEITNETTYLSDIAIHLFLQSSLSIKHIASKLDGTDSGGELIEVLQSPSNTRGRGLSRSSSQVEGVNDMNFEHDSGFSYSTTSSINDGMTPHVPTTKPITNGHCFTTPIDLEKDKKRKYFNNYQKDIKPDATNQIDALQLHDTDSLPLISSSDEELFFNQNYDADDEEVEYIKVEENNNNSCFHEEDEDDLFCLCQTSNEGSIYSLQRALEIIQERPKLTDRLYSQEDSDDCFHESEYDVIDTEDDLDDIAEIVNDDTYPKATVPIIKIRSNSYTEGHCDKISKNYLSRSKNKLKTGKVKSLPNIRFPIRNKKFKIVKRSLTYHGISDLRNETLKEVNEQEELSLNDDSNKSKIDAMYLSPSIKLTRSESEGQNLTSDADYLQTIHKCTNSNDSHADTNVDTQAEDVPPSKFYDFFKRRKKKSPSLKLVSFRRIPSYGEEQQQNGRFRVSSVPSTRDTHDTDTVEKPNVISDVLILGSDTNKNTEHCNGHAYSLEDHKTQNVIECHHTVIQEQICKVCEPNLVETPVVTATHICVALCRNDCIYSSSYQLNSEEITMTEQTVPLRNASTLINRKESLLLLKTYDIITI